LKKNRFYIITKRNIVSFTIGFALFALIITFNFVYFSMLNTPITVYNNKAPSGKLAIVIDDFGESRAGVKEMMSIERHLTFAIMPFLTHSTEDSTLSTQKGFEVIIHLPMEPEKGKLSWVGPRPILDASPSDEIKKIVEDSIKSVPTAVGANIHMGSKASSNERVVTSVLEVIQAQKFYFLDSKTSIKRIPLKVATEKGIPCFENNFFLDSTQSIDKIKSNIRKAGEHALKNGKAIAIGHVGAEGGKVTAQAIKEMLPELDEKGIQLVYLSELLKE